MNDSPPEQTLDHADHRPGRLTLLRVLGPGTAMAVVVGNVIGSGIYAKPGTIAADGGDFRLILLAWITGGVLCLLGALCFAELAVMLPYAGGLYVYLREAYGRLVAFLFGWNEILFNRPGSVGALSIIFVGSLAQVVGWELGPLSQVILATAVIVIVAAVNVLGVIWGGRMQNLTTVIKAGCLILVGLLPFLMLVLHRPGFDPANYSTSIPPQEGTTFATRFGIVLLAVMWAYNGWHGVTPIGEEIRNPQRSIPLALFGGIAILTLLYVLANIAYHGALSMEQIAEAGEHVAEKMVRTLLGDVGGKVMSAVVMCSTFGAINCNLLVVPRVAFAMGRDGVFFPQLGQVHVNYRTPATAIVVMAAMAITLVCATAIWVATVGGEQKSIFDMLTNFVIFAASIFYVLGVLAVIVLRHRHPEWNRPYRTWGYPLVPVLFIVCYLWFLTQVYFGKPLEANIGLMLISLGIPVYFGCKIFRNQVA